MLLVQLRKILCPTCGIGSCLTRVKKGCRFWQRNLSFLLQKVCHSNIVIIVYLENNRVSFCIPSIRKPNVLDLVYVDVCGPIDVEFLIGKKYFVTFIDDFSLKVFEN